MKKLFFTFLTIFTVCSFFACQHKEQQQTENHILGLTKQQKKEQKTTFAIETVKDSVSKKVGKIVCTSTINIDFPIKGNPYLLNSIREWIIDWTYANDTIPIDNYHAIMKDYNANSMKEMADMAQEREADGIDIPDEIEMGYSQEMVIKKIYENDLFVTYCVTTYGYLGGAHGSATGWGTTFRKSDGKVLDHIFRNDKITDVQQMITQELQKDFNVNSWEELKEQLFVDEYASYVPMPQGDPYIVNDSIVFSYQQYEIGAYAIGMPGAKIAINDLRKMLAPSFLKILKPNSTKNK
ncbi:MAG: DUF3298 domain-containing protein [Prevotella sp.]|nr:DUF3298 domain-containing protein [Prevotella sp.]